MTPSVSVITPSYNQGRFIERTIQSVLSQHIAELEYWVIDGASGDQTVSILRRYEQRLHWLSERDRGHSDAVNKGVLRSNAPIVGWLNSDDIYYPGALQAALEGFAAHPDADVIYGDALHIDEADEPIERYPTEDWDWPRFQDVCFISQPAAFFKRSAFERFGMLDVQLKVSVDYEYWIRLAKQGARFVHIGQVLAATRIHDTTFTTRSRVLVHKTNNSMLKRHLGRTPDKWLFDYAHTVLERAGFSRQKRFRFALAVSAVAIYAAVRWNGRISRHMLETTWTWIAGNARDSVKAMLAP